MKNQRTRSKMKASRTQIRKKTKKPKKSEAASNLFSFIPPKLLENLTSEQFFALCTTLVDMKDGVVEMYNDVKPEKKQRIHSLMVQLLEQSDKLNLPKEYKSALGGLHQRLKKMNSNASAPISMNHNPQALPHHQVTPYGTPPHPGPYLSPQPNGHHPHPPHPNGPHPNAGSHYPFQPHGPQYHGEDW